MSTVEVLVNIEIVDIKVLPPGIQVPNRVPNLVTAVQLSAN